MTLIQLLKRFKSYYIKYYIYFILGFIGMILTALGTAFSAWLIEPVLNKIFLEKDMQMLYYLPIAVILAYLAKSLGLYMQVYFISYVGLNILTQLRQKMVDNLLKLDMNFFHKTRNGELISRCTNDINSLQSIVSSILPEFLRESLILIGLLAVVIYQSYILAFFALVVIPLAVYPLMLFARKIKKLATRTQEKNSDLLSKLNELFTNIELIKANSNEKQEGLEFGKHNNQVLNLNIKSMRVDTLVSPMMELMGAFGIAGVIFIGGFEVINGSLDMGKFFSFLTALFMAYTPLKRLSNIYTKIQVAIASGERTFALLDLKTNIKDGEEELLKIDNITLKNISFSYEKIKVLKDINFNFYKGQIFALVGESGGGKSSIINLLLRFYDKTNGNLFINDKDISLYSLKSLRSKIGLVTQNIYIFNDTVAYNVSYANEFDENKVIKALKLANAYEFVEKLGGIYTILSENGKNLSGGQKQRIAIARALYKEPELLIFDEATSALDNESEKAIINTIESLKENRLILIIAHRLSTIENADNIVVIDKGLVVGIGNNNELMKNCELYKKFKQKRTKNNL